MNMEIAYYLLGVVSGILAGLRLAKWINED